MDELPTRDRNLSSFEWAVHEVGLMKPGYSTERAFESAHTRIGFEFAHNDVNADVIMVPALRRARAALETYADCHANVTGSPAVNSQLRSLSTSLSQILLMFRRKQADYSPAELAAGPWKNFIDTSKHINATPGTAVELLIELKTSRLRSLLEKTGAPENESILDTYLDRAVYCLIAAAMLKDGLY